MKWFLLTKFGKKTQITPTILTNTFDKLCSSARSKYFILKKAYETLGYSLDLLEHTEYLIAIFFENFQL